MAGSEKRIRTRKIVSTSPIAAVFGSSAISTKLRVCRSMSLNRKVYRPQFWKSTQAEMPFSNQSFPATWARANNSSQVSHSLSFKYSGNRSNLLRTSSRARTILFRVMDADHILPQSKGGTDHPDNLQLLCSGCNAAIPGPTYYSAECSSKIALRSRLRHRGSLSVCRFRARLIMVERSRVVSLRPRIPLKTFGHHVSKVIGILPNRPYSLFETA